MTEVAVNDSAAGAWAARAGTALELVAPGANRRHVMVRRPGERKVFGFPSAWLQGLGDDAPVADAQPEGGAAAPDGTPTTTEPERCPCCGQVLP